MTDSCKFCSELADIKRVYDLQEKNDPPEDRFKTEYEAAIVSRMWLAHKGKRSANKTVHYRWRGYGFNLNYCPECGKVLCKQKRFDNTGD